MEEREGQVRRLQLALREKERDLERLRCILSSNEETITVCSWCKDRVQAVLESNFSSTNTPHYTAHVLRQARTVVIWVTAAGYLFHIHVVTLVTVAVRVWTPWCVVKS